MEPLEEPSNDNFLDALDFFQHDDLKITNYQSRQ